MANESVATEPDWDAMSSEQFADEMVEILRSSPATLTLDDIDMIDRRWRENTTARRCALVLLVEPGKNFMEGVETDKGFAEAVAEVQVLLPSLLAFSEGISELLKQVRARALVALCGREDMQELMDAADEKVRA